MFNAGGALNDTRAVQIGTVAASSLRLSPTAETDRVIQLISPDTVPGRLDSVRAPAESIATFKSKGEAIAFRADSSAIAWWMKPADKRWYWAARCLTFSF